MAPQRPRIIPDDSRSETLSAATSLLLPTSHSKLRRNATTSTTTGSALKDVVVATQDTQPQPNSNETTSGVGYMGRLERLQILLTATM